MKKVKNRYMGYSLGRKFYTAAYSAAQAKDLLRRQALKDVGRYDFKDYFLFNVATNQWEKTIL